MSRTGTLCIVAAVAMSMPGKFVYNVDSQCFTGVYCRA